MTNQIKLQQFYEIKIEKFHNKAIDRKTSTQTIQNQTNQITTSLTRR